MSPSLLARFARSSLTAAAAALASMALVAGCASTPEQAATPTTAPAATAKPTTTAPPMTAKGTVPTEASADEEEEPPGDDAPGTTTEAPADPDAVQLPAGATPGLDDYDENGEPDPTCGTQDFGGGLVLRIPCEIRTASEPPEGTKLVSDSLYRLPSISSPAFENVSATTLVARNAEGAKVLLVFFNSDAMFSSGSATFDADATAISLEATLKFINATYPGGTIQVRGHTDNAGAEAANQQLAEARAGAVKGWFESHAVDATKVTSIGFGESQPLVENQNEDGSDNVAGMNFNRRVEIVVTLPA